MEYDKVDLGYFQPIAQMRRLAMVLPKSLEIGDLIPVKFCLPDQTKSEYCLDFLSERTPGASLGEDSEQEKNIDVKAIAKTDEDNIEKNSHKLTEVSEKHVDTSNKKIEMAGKEIEWPDIQVENSEKEMVGSRSQKETAEIQVLKFDKQIQTSDKEGVDSVKNSHKGLKVCRATPDFKSRPHQSEQIENSDGSESEAGTVQSVAIQVDFLPGRNQRAVPRSRAGSQNSIKMSLMKDHDDKLQHHRRRKDSESKSRIFPCEIEKDLMDFLVQERKNEYKRDMHRHLVKKMINDEYQKKRPARNGHSSDVEPSTYARCESKLRPQSMLSQQSTVSGRAVDKKWKKHHYSHQETNRRLANWVRSQDIRKFARNTSSPLGGDKEDAENIVMIVKEEFKRLGFL